MTHIQDDLVEELHRVAAKHERHNVPVNLVAESIDIDGSDAVDVDVAVLIEEFPRRVDLGATAGGVGVDTGRRWAVARRR